LLLSTFEIVCPQAFNDLEKTAMGKRRSLKTLPPLLGEAITLWRCSKRRSTPRIPARRAAWLTLKSSDVHESVGLVRDISARGIFFYSDFAPAVGDVLDFVVEFLSGPDQTRLHLKGTVVRVEQLSGGGSPGVAVSFKTRRSRQ